MHRPKFPIHRPGRPSRVALGGYVTGILLVSATATAAVLASEPRDGPAAPANSLAPGDSSTPPGGSDVPVPVNSQLEVVGRFRILSVGSVPNIQPGILVVPAKGDIEGGYDLLSPAQEAAAKSSGASRGVPPWPAGFQAKLAGVDVAAAPGEPAQAWREGYRLTSPGQFDVVIQVRKMFPGATWELVAYGDETGHGFSRVDVDGVTVLVVHGTGTSKVQPAVQAYFIQDDWLVYVDAPALPLDLLDQLLRSFIAFRGKAAGTAP